MPEYDEKKLKERAATLSDDDIKVLIEIVSTGGLKNEYDANIAAVLSDYIRLRKVESIMKTLLKADISKSEAPYHSLNVWGTDNRNGECGCNFYGEHVGYEIAWYWIKNKLKDYSSIEQANEAVLRKSNIFEAIMNGMNALVMAKEDAKDLIEIESSTKEKEGTQE